MYKILQLLFFTIITTYCSLSFAYSSQEKTNGKINTNELLKSYLELSALKHKVISENIANVNTPSYKANDIDITNQYKNLPTNNKSGRKARLSCTSSKHLLPSKDENRKFLIHKLQNPYETKNNGNNVSLTQQNIKLSQNRNDYNTALKVYNTSNSLFLSVIGK